MKNVVLGGGFLAVALAVAACSSSSPTSDPESSQPVKEAPARETSSSSSSSGGSKATTTEPAGSATTTAPTQQEKDAMQACFTDCASQNGEGADQFAAIAQPCACASDVCGKVCGDACQGSKNEQLLASASSECRTCVMGAVKQGGACSADIQSKCMSQSSCLSFGLCAIGCNSQ